MILTKEQIERLNNGGGYPRGTGSADLLDTIADLRSKLEAETALCKANSTAVGELTERLEESERCVDAWIDQHEILRHALNTAERQLAELREPMACGHPKACWERIPRMQQMVDSEGLVDKYHCTICAPENELRECLLWALGHLGEPDAKEHNKEYCDGYARSMAVLGNPVLESWNPNTKLAEPQEERK